MDGRNKVAEGYLTHNVAAKICFFSLRPAAKLKASERTLHYRAQEIAFQGPLCCGDAIARKKQFSYDEVTTTYGIDDGGITFSASLIENSDRH